MEAVVLTLGNKGREDRMVCSIKLAVNQKGKVRPDQANLTHNAAPALKPRPQETIVIFM